MTKNIDKHIALTKMKLHHHSSGLSFISTIWIGRYVMCSFDNARSCILNCSGFLPDEDTREEELCEIIKEFIT